MEKELCKLSIELRARPSLFPLLSSCSHTMGLGDSLRAPHVFGDLTCKLNFIFLKARMLASKKKITIITKKNKIFYIDFFKDCSICPTMFCVFLTLVCIGPFANPWG